jgi:hypothetical protein
MARHLDRPQQVENIRRTDLADLDRIEWGREFRQPLRPVDCGLRASFAPDLCQPIVLYPPE